MLFKINFILWFLGLPIFSFCQSKLKIVSAEDKSILSYATIRNVTKNVAFSASKEGEASLKGIGDSIIVSYAGYKDLSFINNKEDKVVTLYRVKKFLPEVIVFSCVKMKTFFLKNALTPRKYGEVFFEGINWHYTDITNPYAILINDVPENSSIKTFSFWIEKKWGSPDSMELAPMMIMAYSVDSLTQLPGDPLFSKPIIYFPKREGKQTLNLDSNQLYAPRNGLFLSIMYIIDKKYSWEENIKTQSGADTSIINYGAIINGRLDLGKYSAFIFDLAKNKWIKYKPNLVIGFEIKYKLCPDKGKFSYSGKRK